MAEIARKSIKSRNANLVQQRVLPQSEHHHVGPVPGAKGGEKVLRRVFRSYISESYPNKFTVQESGSHYKQLCRYLFSVRAHLDGIGNEAGRLLLRHGADVL